MLPAQRLELRTPDMPCVEVLASESGGISARVRWCPNPTLRDKCGQPIQGSRYQVRFAQVFCGSEHAQDNELQQPIDLEWQVQLPILEESVEPISHEVVHQIWGFVPGITYCFAVRMGDALRWSNWSMPSEPKKIAV